MRTGRHNNRHQRSHQRHVIVGVHELHAICTVALENSRENTPGDVSVQFPSGSPKS